MSNLGSVVASVGARTLAAGLVVGAALAFAERPARLPDVAAPDSEQLAFDPTDDSEPSGGDNDPLDGRSDDGRSDEEADSGNGLTGSDGSTLVGEEILAQPEIGYGTSAALDVLWDACEDGDGGACDQLFTAAPLGSAYEQFGLSCGNRPLVIDCATELIEQADLNGLVDLDDQTNLDDLVDLDDLDDLDDSPGVQQRAE